MKSVMQAGHSFAKTPRVNTPRSVFKLDHAYKTTTDAGTLFPCYVTYVYPGDTFIMNTNAFARMSTPIFPIMDNIYMDFFAFVAPFRLLWSNYDKFFGAQVDPGDSISYTIPVIDVDGKNTGSLVDYFGLPVEITSTPVNVSSLPFRAYNLIWNTWFRDQNLQDSVTVDLGDGPDSIANYGILNRGKRHDIYTSCVPYPQKNDSTTGTLIPMSGDAPIIGMGKLDQTYGGSAGTAYETDGTGTSSYTSYSNIDNTAAGDRYLVEEDPNNAGYPNIRADFENVNDGATINELRQAFQIQKFLERDMRGGTRYIEKILAHFGVLSPDLRASRPQYLGGGSFPIHMNPVARTNDFASNQGADMSAFATGVSEGDIGFRASFTEHGVLMVLGCARADLTYGNPRIDRFWSLSTQYDMYWPEFAHLGEQAILNKEIWFTDGAGTIADNDLTFGYSERYAELRYEVSKITGQFRPDVTGSINEWHLAEDFATLPTLNSTFIKCDPPIDRVIATPTEPHFMVDIFHNITAVRPVPIYGIPGMADHF